MKTFALNTLRPTNAFLTGLTVAAFALASFSYFRFFTSEIPLDIKEAVKGARTQRKSYQFPVFPNSTELSSYTNNQLSQATFSSQEAADRIFSYYKTTMEVKGWDLKNSVASAQNFSAKFEKEELNLSLTITQEQTGKSIINIEYSRD